MEKSRNHCDGKAALKRNPLLENVSTKELREELEKRPGVLDVAVSPYQKIEVGGLTIHGPAVILIDKNKE